MACVFGWRPLGKSSLTAFCVHTWYPDRHNEVQNPASVKALWTHLQWSPCSKSNDRNVDLVLLWFKNKKKTTKKFFLVFDTLDLCRVCLHMKACCPVVLVKILSKFWIGCHTFSVNTIACSTVPCMILVPSYILHDRLWCGFILCLTCTWKQNVFIPSTSSVFHFDLFGKRIRAITKTSWRSSDGYGFKFPLFRVILYLYERPVLNGLWIWGGKD